EVGGSARRAGEIGGGWMGAGAAIVAGPGTTLCRIWLAIPMLGDVERSGGAPEGEPRSRGEGVDGARDGTLGLRTAELGDRVGSAVFDPAGAGITSVGRGPPSVEFGTLGGPGTTYGTESSGSCSSGK